mmetsp:Transcript_6647/g.13846  ORF Transcript_6647/g.13846 Transcript_6647/m.13846 type:complete len:229 (+) Transcript_6647:3875-4561(+)
MVLVEALDHGEELRVTQNLLGVGPVGGLAHENHNALEGSRDGLWRVGVSLDLTNRTLVQLVDLLHGLLQCGQCNGEVGLRVGGDRQALSLLLTDTHTISLDSLLLLVSHAPLGHDDDKELLALLLALSDGDLLHLELLAHHLDLLLTLLELLEAVAELVPLLAQLLPFLGKELQVALNELQVVSGGDVVVPLELLDHSVGRGNDAQVRAREDRSDGVAVLLLVELDLG